MERKSFSGMHCSVAQCLEVIGEWWTMLIVRDAFLGVRRFDDFKSRLGISRNVLTQRLGRLVDHGVLEKVLYSEHPPRHEYRLTDKGLDLWPILSAMRQWGDTWASPAGPPVIVEHRACGSPLGAVMICGACGRPAGPHDVSVRAGPGNGDVYEPAAASRDRSVSPRGRRHDELTQWRSS